MFTYKAMRYYAPIKDEYNTLEEALQRAASDVEWNAAAPVEIVDDTGAVVLDQEEIYKRVDDLLEPRSTPSTSVSQTHIRQP